MKSEQIRYLQALWDRIVDHPGEVPVPESHMELVQERLAAYRHDPSRARPAHEVLDRLRKKPISPAKCVGDLAVVLIG